MSTLLVDARLPDVPDVARTTAALISDHVLLLPV
jgi:hypothetical protein